MKIEMGESLAYSWLRHVIGCQIVQTNWKTSPVWDVMNIEKLEMIKKQLADLKKTYDIKVFAKKGSLKQIFKQAECDAIGIAYIDSDDDEKPIVDFYGVNVAFHHNGLNYKDNIKKVLEKSIGTALCLYGFLGAKKANIVFATPKMNKNDFDKLRLCIADINKQFKLLDFDLNYVFYLYANDDFKKSFLDTVMTIQEISSDTSELFLRNMQLYKMFYWEHSKNNFVRICRRKHRIWEIIKNLFNF